MKVKDPSDLVIQNLKQRQTINQLNRKILHLQGKFNSLHAVVLQNSGLTIVNADHPNADISPVTTRMNKNATTTVIAVAGMALGLGMPPREFGAALNSSSCNLIFIKDFKQSWYQKGLLGLAGDLTETAEFLRTLIPPETKMLNFIGSSAGGFAAIQLGIRLNADKILTFGPQTKIDKGVFKKFSSIDSNAAEYEFGHPDADLRNSLESFPDFSGQIEVMFGGRNKADRTHAERIASDPRVTLTPLDDDSHNSAGFLKKQGLLGDVLERFVQPN